MNAARLWSSGFLSRFHANLNPRVPKQTLADHHGRVAQLLLALHPDPPPRLLRVALTHDVAEVATGDVPWPVKASRPALAAALDDAEAEMRALWRLPEPRDLTAIERRWLDLCDRLDAELWLAAHAGAAEGAGTLVAEAHSLGGLDLAEAVHKLIETVEGAQ